MPLARHLVSLGIGTSFTNFLFKLLLVSDEVIGEFLLFPVEAKTPKCFTLADAQDIHSSTHNGMTFNKITL